MSRHLCVWLNWSSSQRSTIAVRLPGQTAAHRNDAAGGDAQRLTPRIQYVSTFVSNASGDKFNPHVSIGIAPKDYLDRLLAEPFVPFTFSLAGAAVYQPGPFGTAAKRLRKWDPKPVR